MFLGFFFVFFSARQILKLQMEVEQLEDQISNAETGEATLFGECAIFFSSKVLSAKSKKKKQDKKLS